MNTLLATKINALHQKAQSVAFSYYLRKGLIPPVLHEILKATTSFEAFFKYNPDQPRVPAGNADGGQWTSGGNGTLTDGITPVYPLETAILLFLGGASALGDAAEGVVGIATEDEIGLGTQDANAITQKLVETLAPDGQLIGNAGSDPSIREISGGMENAKNLLQNLTQGGAIDPRVDYNGTAWTMPDGSFIGYRPTSDSGKPTIDLNIPAFGKTLRKLKFVDGD